MLYSKTPYPKVAKNPSAVQLARLPEAPKTCVSTGNAHVPTTMAQLPTISNIDIPSKNRPFVELRTRLVDHILEMRSVDPMMLNVAAALEATSIAYCCWTVYSVSSMILLLLLAAAAAAAYVLVVKLLSLWQDNWNRLQGVAGEIGWLHLTNSKVYSHFICQHLLTRSRNVFFLWRHKKCDSDVRSCLLLLVETDLRGVTFSILRRPKPEREDGKTDNGQSKWNSSNVGRKEKVGIRGRGKVLTVRVHFARTICFDCETKSTWTL